MSVKEFIKEVQAGKVNVVESTQKALDEIDFIDNQYHFFNITICNPVS